MMSEQERYVKVTCIGITDVPQGEAELLLSKQISKELSRLFLVFDVDVCSEPSAAARLSRAAEKDTQAAAHSQLVQALGELFEGHDRKDAARASLEALNRLYNVHGVTIQVQALPTSPLL